MVFVAGDSFQLQALRENISVETEKFRRQGAAGAKEVSCGALLIFAAAMNIKNWKWAAKTKTAKIV